MGLELFLSNLAPGRSSGPAHVWNHKPDAEAEFEAAAEPLFPENWISAELKLLLWQL